MSDTDPRSAFIDTSLWHGSLDRSREILAAHPDLADSDIHTAAILGNDVAVKRFLELDLSNATAKGGPRGWDALTHLCFSKYLRLERARSDGFVRAATALLDAGASPNTGFFAEDHQPHPAWESVLYGAAGVAHDPEMTRLLLERGADPNDAEVVYHTPETLDNRAMKVLVESGRLTAESMAMLLARKFDWQDDQGVAWLLSHGVDPNHAGRWGMRPLHKALNCDCPLAYFELLLDRGADPLLTDQHGRTACALAARMARADVLERFEQRGFTCEVHGDDAFLAACARADADRARAVAAADPSVIRRLEAETPELVSDVAGSGNVAALRLLLDLGFDANVPRSQPRWLEGQTALHVATARGRRECAGLLIARGAKLDARNSRGLTPLGVAFLCLEQQSEWTPNEHTLGIARALIQAGASLEKAPLTLAAAACLGLAEDVERLGRQAGKRDVQVALAAAAYNAVASAVPALMALGADPNAPNEGLNPGATSLHNAVCSGSLATVQALVAAGARADVRDAMYQATSREWAEYFVREKRPEPKEDAAIAAFLRSWRSDR